MKEYIEREAVIDLITRRYECPEICTAEINSIPAADVVPKGAYDQVAWERDVAIEQLREDYGVGLGEKKRTDVVEVVRCGQCRYEGTVDCPMSGTAGKVSASDFCSYGERRSDDG
jgi:hypothetical protein